MRRWLYIIAVTALVGCSPQKGPIPYYASKFINLGVIKLNHSYHGSFSIKNVGDKELKIDQVTSDCECTLIKGYKNTINPNESTTIHYDLTPHTTGYDQQNIFIKNNSVKESTILIAIRAKVEL